MKAHFALLYIPLISTTLYAPTSVVAEEAPVTPYRPSISSPAQLPAPGQLEMELGGLHQRMAGEQRNSSPYLLKLAFNHKWGVLLGGEATVSTHDADNKLQGVGDTNLVMKRAWIFDEENAAGVEFGVKFPTAGNGLGSGSTDYTINTIYSKDIGTIHMDLNLNETFLGTVDAGTSSSQLGLSVSFSKPLSEQWGINAELSEIYRGGVPNTLQFLGALTFSPTKRLTMDIGIMQTVQTSPSITSFFGGIVFPLGTLF